MNTDRKPTRHLAFVGDTLSSHDHTHPPHQLNQTDIRLMRISSEKALSSIVEYDLDEKPQRSRSKSDIRDCAGDFCFSRLSSPSTSTSSKSQESLTSISTDCDSCHIDSIQRSTKSQSNSSSIVQTTSTPDSSLQDSLIICNLNATNNDDEACDKMQNVEIKHRDNVDLIIDSDDDDFDENEEINKDTDRGDDDGNFFHYMSRTYSSSNIVDDEISCMATQILLSFEDDEDSSDRDNRLRSPAFQHLLFLESYATGRPALNRFANNQRYIIEKICTTEDRSHLNKYLFLLDQYARLCANFADEPILTSRRRSSLPFPYLFPQPLPARPAPCGRNRFLRAIRDSKKMKNKNNLKSSFKEILSSQTKSSVTLSSLLSLQNQPLSYLDPIFVHKFFYLICEQFAMNKENNNHTNDVINSECSKSSYCNNNCDSTSNSFSDQRNDNKQICDMQNITHFCVKILVQFPELIRSDLLEGSRANSTIVSSWMHSHSQPLISSPFPPIIAENFNPEIIPRFGTSDPLRYESMDNYRFVAFVRTHFHALEEDGERLAHLALEPETVRRVVEALYSRYNLEQLFSVYHSVARFIRGIYRRSVLHHRMFKCSESSSSSSTITSSTSSQPICGDKSAVNDNEDTILSDFFESTFRHRKSPLFDVWHDLTAAPNISEIGDLTHFYRSLSVFCYRSALYRYAHCLATSLDRDYLQSSLPSEMSPSSSSSLSSSASDHRFNRLEHCYATHPIRSIDSPACCSLIGALYKLTIQLTLLASAYCPERGDVILKQLLRIKVYDFDFKHSLQQALDIVDNELTSINFDLQNRQHNIDLLLIDSDDMDDIDRDDDEQWQEFRLNRYDHFASLIDGSPNLNHVSQSDTASKKINTIINPASGDNPILSIDPQTSDSFESSIESESGSTSPDRFILQSSMASSQTTTAGSTLCFSNYDSNNNNEAISRITTIRSARRRSPTDGELIDIDSPNRAQPPIDIPIGLSEKRALLDKIKTQGMSLLAPPNNRWSFAECSVCCETQWLLIRSCCSFAACLTCLGAYYTSRIEMGNLSVECIGDRCGELVYRAEVIARLSPEKRELYNRLLLMQSSECDRSKPCPQCNTILTLTPQRLRAMKRANKLRLLNAPRQLMFGAFGSLHRGKAKKYDDAKGGSVSSTPANPMSSLISDSFVYKVECERCNFFWCFKCHSPWHEGLSCKQFMKGDTLLKSWAKHVDFNGQVNAQKCPKCKIYIQRTSGCDHMLCARCKTDFCYKCGDRLKHVKFFGDHYSRLSILGCKYRYKPDKPLQRRLIRGTVFGGKLMLLPVLSTVCLCAGAVVLALGIAALPLFGGVRFYRRFCRSNQYDHNNDNDNVHVIDQIDGLHHHRHRPTIGNHANRSNIALIRHHHHYQLVNRGILLNYADNNHNQNNEDPHSHPNHPDDDTENARMHRHFRARLRDTDASARTQFDFSTPSIDDYSTDYDYSHRFINQNAFPHPNHKNNSKSSDDENDNKNNQININNNTSDVDPASKLFSLYSGDSDIKDQADHEDVQFAANHNVSLENETKLMLLNLRPKKIQSK